MGLALIYLIITGIISPHREEDKTYLGDGETRGGLPPADSAQARLVLHDAVRDSHLPAQGGQEHDQLQQNKLLSALRGLKLCWKNKIQLCVKFVILISGEKVQDII